jgi:hypothetical protein
MSQKLYFILSGVVFLLVSVLHLLRLIYVVPVVFGTTEIPMALSYVGFPAALAYCLWAVWLLRAGVKR